MKSVIWLFILILCFNLLIASDFEMPNRKPIVQEISRKVVSPNSRWAPEVIFNTDPQDITLSYFDYMIGSYNNLPLRRQPETSAPYMYTADGMYVNFMYQETTNSLRRVYYSYIDLNGNISTPAAISSNAVREGYPGIGIDPVTANPFVSWHAVVEADETYDCLMSYDMFNVVGGPGLWKQPFIVIDNPEVSADSTGHDDDEFIWPQVWVGPSPIGGMRRVHIYGNNYTNNTNGIANYNSIYGYSDFEYDEINFDMSLTEWTYRTFEVFDNWHYNDVKRSLKDMCVSDDGQVAFIGHAGDSLFIYHSSDYGETFDFYMENAHWEVFNPQNTDGSYVFENTNGSPGDLFIEPNGDGSHYNVLFTEDNTRLVFMTAFGLNTVETASNDQYYPAHFHPKIVYFDILEQDFEFVDLQITGVDPYDDQPMIPYDLDEDGEVDSYDEDGKVEFVSCWPSHYFEGDFQDGAFHESCFKMTQNEEMGWLAVFFMDGRYLMEAYDEEPGFEDWSEIAQIAISVSLDYGVTWSEPAYMNAKADDENYYPQLDGMLPCYIYPADEIEIIDEFHGRIPVFFFNDNSYGSFASPVGAGQNTGGTITYAVLDLDFTWYDSDNNNIVAHLNLAQNYPNPFNPSTTIGYELKETANVELTVFNIKGQKVKTLVDERKQPGYHSIVWDGKDSNNREMNSGIYFYKINTGKYSSAKKMILMK